MRSIIDELDRLVPQRDKHQIIEAKASNVIASCINIMQLISESFTDDEAEELNKRLLLAIKNKDATKFNRKIKEMKKAQTRDE
jgi:hypothetical protein